MITNFHSSRTDDQRDRIDLVDFGAVFSALRRNFLLIAIVTGMSIAAAFFYLTRLAVPLYSATATVVLNTSQSDITALDPLTPAESFEDSAVLNTEMAILRSNDLLRRVVELENLADDPEFNWHLNADPDEVSVEDPAMLAQRTANDTLHALRGALTISSVRDSYVFLITAITTDPVKSQKIANTTAQVYLDNQIALKTDTTQNAVIWLQQRVDDLQLQLIEARARIGEFQLNSDPTDRFEFSVQLERLNGEAQTISELHQHFLRRLKEAAVRQGMHRPDGRILSRAEVPAEPSSPRKKVILFFSAIIGGIVALGLVFVREMLSNTLRSPKELERTTGLPLVGATPKVPGSSWRSNNPSLIGQHSPQYISALEDLQASLMMLQSSSDHKVIAVCSAVAGEGRTSLVMSLAASLAESGKRVLVIDADLRGKTLANLAETRVETGLVALCEGRASFDDAVTHSAVLNADLMVCEDAPNRPVDLLSSKEFADVVAAARQRYSYVLVDTPPILDAPDVRLIGRHVDSLVFLSQWDSTPLASVRAAVDVLGRSGLDPVGVVITQINSARFQKARHEILPGEVGSGLFHSSKSLSSDTSKPRTDNAFKAILSDSSGEADKMA